ncbi:class I mannose-6-phosphate isomerase [Atopobacter sp. AH10]|uniref:type I phosphomannose isomerase catalytic subunit n=1 Tax=Atopobacter sp. AH10 TaxID=2315861 RepID=UPI000EF1B186|nr:type I phosphomannose isomerase catalytic subunit [Atopobacter sp. AH10]RLK63130.1 class I mannose-6-phosphate isomerase [Atopobacter sp. AH10]
MTQATAYQEPLFLHAHFSPKIWGHEDWVISAHKNGPSIVAEGTFKGLTLTQVWEEHPEIFGVDTSKAFPLLVKVLYVDQDLSVQVHPDNAYALAHEGEYGKNECWYILDAIPNASIVYGHHAQTKKEFAQLLNEGRFCELLASLPVKKGDFVNVPTGTIHALKAGLVALEIQQSSDTTYRLYDYDRVNKDTGMKRELHLKQAIDVTRVPHEVIPYTPKIEKLAHGQLTTLLENDYFIVRHLELKGKANLEASAPYSLLDIFEGEGRLLINDKIYPLTNTSHLILPNGVTSYQIEGDLQLMLSTAK